MVKSRYVIIGTLMLMINGIQLKGQDEWSGMKQQVLLKSWSLNASYGFTSYFGDLSQYDLQAMRKTQYESLPAYGIKITKSVRNFLLLSGSFIYGGFKSDYRPTYSFQTRLLEYSIQAGIDPVRFVFPEKDFKYGSEVYVGTGQFLFQTSKYRNSDGIQTPDRVSTGVPEFVYFFGACLFFELSERVKATADLSIRQAQNDNIDKYLANGDFDYYSLMCFGITYSFGRVYYPIKYESSAKVNKKTTVWRSEIR